MTEQTPPKRPSANPDATAEKLHAITALFGQRIAARVDPAAGAAADDPTPQTETDRTRWQKNRLIEHLRRQGAMPPAGGVAGDAAGDVAGDEADARSDPAISQPLQPVLPPVHPGSMTARDLANEHPAILAKLLSESDQPTRVMVLRRLPGWLARDVMRRLKAMG